MKAKTIKSILQKKHNDFVESIKDEKVQKLVKKNSIITGGCIVSLLLGEKVNDFDYYFTNKETALAVAKYYCNEFNEAHPEKREAVVIEEDDRIKVFIRSSGITEEDEYELNWDEPATVFENGEEPHLDDIKEITAEDDKEKYRPVFLSSNAISLSNRIQIITRFYGDVDEIHSTFDFEHAKCYWRAENGHLELPRASLEAILTKELIYTGSKYPLCSIFRTKKFIQRGWTINAGQYLKMALQLNQLDLLDIKTLEDQLIGVDSAFFMSVINTIKDKLEQDPNFKLDNRYLFTVINRIF